MCETRGEDWGQGTARSRAEALRPHLGPRADVPTQPVSLPRGRRRHSGGSRTERGALGQLKLCLPGPSVTPPPRNSCTLCPSPPSPPSFLLPQLQHCPRQPLTPTLSPAGRHSPVDLSPPKFLGSGKLSPLLITHPLIWTSLTGGSRGVWGRALEPALVLASVVVPDAQ